MLTSLIKVNPGAVVFLNMLINRAGIQIQAQLNTIVVVDISLDEILKYSLSRIWMTL